jgi:hypothetical protein
MKESPILFSAPMVRAILAGKKTQTRRIVQPQPVEVEDWDRGVRYWEWKGRRWAAGFEGKIPYQVGMRLWVKETWYYEDHMHDVTDGEPGLPEGLYSHRLIYRADQPDYPVKPKGWRFPIHMPRWASRITLGITEVRMERLQDISAEDARKEGIIDGGCINCGGNEPCGCNAPRPDARDGFAGEWEAIYGKRPGCSWHDSPWVWVVEFKRLEVRS